MFFLFLQFWYSNSSTALSYSAHSQIWCCHYAGAQFGYEKWFSADSTRFSRAQSLEEPLPWEHQTPKTAIGNPSCYSTSAAALHQSFSPISSKSYPRAGLSCFPATQRFLNNLLWYPACDLLQAPEVTLGLLIVISHRGLHPWMGVLALPAQKQGNCDQWVTSVVLQSPWQRSGK